MKKYCLAIALVALLALVGCAEHEHSWKEEVVKEATCGAPGLKVYTCEVCEATREEEIPATGEHTWDSGVVSTEPKCTEDGVKTFTCAVCKETKTEKIPATGHSYEWKTLKEADCVNDGSEEEVCSKCDAKGNTREVKALGHNFEGDICTGCKNSKTFIENAEARIGTTYYPTFKEAVFAAVNATENDKKTVEVLKDKIALGNHLPVNGSITINANNCDFYSETGEHDIAIYTFKENGEIASAADIREHGEDISIIVNDAKNLKVWGQLNASKEGDVINIELNNCHNEKLSLSSQDGEMVMLRGTDLDKGSVAIKMNSCSVKGTDTAVHSVFAKEVSISNCTFEDCAVPVNLNYKQTGACNVLVENCEFIDCGESGTSDIAKYSAPIRIVNKSSEPALVKIKGVSVNNTLSELGDVLLVDSRTGETFKSLSATFEGNKTDLKVKVSVDGDLETVAAGASATLKVEVPTT